MAPGTSRPIVFLTDFGIRGDMVGVCHGVMAGIAPEARIIDLSHGVPPQDVFTGALLLSDSLPFMPADAVAVAVVDPGVGTGRRELAVEAADGRLLVGPDNGLLSLAWQAVGGAKRAVEITSPVVLARPVAKIFHARDVFAPAAAHLARGMPLEELGPSAEVESLVSLRVADPEVEPGKITAEVLDIDRFGNVQLNVRGSHLAEAGLRGPGGLSVETTALAARAKWVDTYGEVGPGEYGAVEDARGWVSLIRFKANAADGLGVRMGDPVWLTAARA